MLREIVLDTETTGLVPTDGHRLIEIGAVELFNHLPTGRVFHSYVNPGRDVPAEALTPRSTWADPAEYDRQAGRLAKMFHENFKSFEDRVSPDVRAAGPV